jgi:hypothetical protein
MCKAGNVPDMVSTVIEPAEVWKMVGPPFKLKANEKLPGWYRATVGDTSKSVEGSSYVTSTSTSEPKRAGE